MDSGTGCELRAGSRATTVLELCPHRPLARRSRGADAGERAAHSAEEPKLWILNDPAPIGELMTQLLARYGLSEKA